MRCGTCQGGNVNKKVRVDLPLDPTHATKSSLCAFASLPCLHTVCRALHATRPGQRSDSHSRWVWVSVGQESQHKKRPVHVKRLRAMGGYTYSYPGVCSSPAKCPAIGWHGRLRSVTFVGSTLISVTYVAPRFPAVPSDPQRSPASPAVPSRPQPSPAVPSRPQPSPAERTVPSQANRPQQSPAHQQT